MNHSDYLEYKQYEEEIKETLETQYQMAMFNKDFEAAYNTLGSLMAYKLIDRNDPRIENTNKTYSKGGIEKSHRFRLDYRKDYGYIPSWLFGEIELSHICECKSIEHWGKRVEGNYEGDAIFPSRNIELRITICTTTKKVSNAFDNIEKILNAERNQKFKREPLESLCKEGVYRVFNIEVESSCLSSNKIIGYAIAKMGDNGAEVTLVIKYDSIIGNWVPVKSTIGTIQNTLKIMLGGNGKFKIASGMENAINKQQGMLNASNAKYLSNDKQAK